MLKILGSYKLLFAPFLLLCAVLFSSQRLNAQTYQSGFDDYNAFSSDPLDLDEESTNYFGRFFQSSLLLGTGIFSGDLGKANSAGFSVGLKFVYYFDRLWAAEIGGSWNRHSSFYNQNNTGLSGVDVQMSTTLIPVLLGMRFSFDRENLPRSIAMMNPYVAANGEVIFRTETVEGASTTSGLPSTIAGDLSTGSINSSTAFGVAFGGGLEFDVYRNKLMLGFDLRYHFTFWSDSDVFVGNIGRGGNYFTLLATMTHNY